MLKKQITKVDGKAYVLVREPGTHTLENRKLSPEADRVIAVYAKG